VCACVSVYVHACTNPVSQLALSATCSYSNINNSKDKALPSDYKRKCTVCSN